VLNGGAGSDLMRGSAGDDTIDGGTGEADNVGADRLEGFAGADTLTESLGRNILEGGAGNDTLLARDAVVLSPPDDQVNGQSGTDRCQIDASDVALSCEVFLP
jgi:Ca2+-binding RTX toxin-like protein